MQSGPCVMMRVSDTGEGMPDDVIEHIFEPFFSTKPTDKGTGLGLSQVYGIVKQYGGEILVESRINKGTHFTIYWPLAKKQIEKKETIKDTQTFGEDATILLVEDQPSVRRVVEKILGSLGYRVLCANDGLEALSVYESGKSEIDLVLSDIVMPGMNGQTLVESLPDVPFILMTGYPLNAVDQKLPTNVKGFMLKPVERNKVAQAVFEALGADAKGV